MACVPQVCHGLPHIHNQRLALVLRWHVPAHHVYFQRAALIKLPVTGEPQLDDAALAAAVEEAHDLNLKVARQNLAGMRKAGATVLYGTDLGNTSTAAIDPGEITALLDAGLDGEAILEAGTSAPAAYWGFSDLGRIEEGKAASFLVLDRDPLEDPLALSEPVEVWMDGVRVK